MVCLMSMGGARISLSETLFDDSSESDAPDNPFPEESLSQEMRALTEKVTKKVERRRAKPKTMAASVFNRAIAEVEVMIESDDWTGVAARHLVALYDQLHLECYDVACAELGPSERYNAVMMAAGFVKREFDGDYKRAVDFMNWAWTREIGTEKWRRENGRTDGRRIGVRLMFGGALLSDYRVTLARTHRRP